MILNIEIYDDKKYDINSQEFKEKITEAVKQTVLKDWDKYTKIVQYEDPKDGTSAYRTIVELFRD